MPEYLNVEKPFLDKLRQLNWTVIDQCIGIPQEPEKSLRNNFKEVVLHEEFKKAISYINFTAIRKWNLRATTAKLRNAESNKQGYK